MKKCTSCEQEFKATSEFFNKRKQSKDGLSYKCKTCDRNRKDRTSAKRKRFNSDLDRGFKVCTKCNTEKPIAEYMKAGSGSRTICKSCHAENQRAQRKDNKANNLEHHSIRESLNGARKRAKNNSYDFNVTIEDLMPFPTHCPIFGTKLSYGLGDKEYGATLDKVIPSKGYTKDNVVIISARANRLKADNTVETLKLILDYLT